MMGREGPGSLVCADCGAISPEWGMCLAKGLGAWRGHSWREAIPDEARSPQVVQDEKRSETKGKL